ncbi:MAG: hypothetical protein GY708_19115 [Actinomycetia bacterium]|nr:hypothetical protein [Actinomycetes bacterium]
MSVPQLAGLTAATADVVATAEVFGLITGGLIAMGPSTRGPSTLGTDRSARVCFDDITIEIVSNDTAQAGICGVTLACADIIGPVRTSGVTVTSIGSLPVPEIGGDVIFDHIALGVLDLAEARAAWIRLTGLQPHDVGVHPVSGGAFEAVRFELGHRMIELVSPAQGVQSPMSTRLAKYGDAALALALPANDLAAKVAELETAGMTVLDQPPHRLVHPRNTGGVMVQLTPRVEH